MKTSGHDRRTWAVCLILTLGVFAIYGPALRSDFVNFDDQTYVTENAIVQKGLTGHGLVWAFTTGHGSNWHPLTWLSHMLDCQLYGVKPAGHHLTNLLLHALNSVLLFQLLRRMTGALWRSAAVAALFAWHPLHVESVAWIAERKDVLSTAFGLLTLLAWLRYVENPGRLRFALALLGYALSLMSKPMLVTLPFLLLLLDYWPLERSFKFQDSGFKSKADEKCAAWGKLLREKLPFFALALLSSVVTFLVQRHGGAVASVATIPLSQRLANTLLSYAVYLRKMVWPSDLAVFYPMPVSFSVLQLAIAGAVLALVSILVIVWRKQRPWLVTGWLWYLGMLVPVIGLVQVGEQSMADRYSYLPLVGIFIMLVWGVAEIPGPEHFRRPKLGWAIALPVLLACLLTARAQTGYWKDSIVLFRHALAVTPDNATAHVNLGTALNRAGRPSEAREEFFAALKAGSDSSIALAGYGAFLGGQGDTNSAVKYLDFALARNPAYGDAHYNLGNIFAAEGDLTNAAAHFAEALRLNPDAPDAHNNLGLVLARMGRYDEAAAQFKAALALKPDYPEAEDLLGGCLLKLGRPDEARVHYAEALRLKPDLLHARLRLGVLLVQLGRLDEAAAFYRESLRVVPDRPELLRDFAWFLATNPQATLRNGPEAVRLAGHAVQLLKQPDPATLAALDAAYAEAGRFADAIKTAEQIRELALASSQADAADRAAKRLESYRAGKPWRE